MKLESGSGLGPSKWLDLGAAAVTNVAADMAHEHGERRPDDGVDDQPHQQLLLRRRAAGDQPVAQSDRFPRQVIMLPGAGYRSAAWAILGNAGGSPCTHPEGQCGGDTAALPGNDGGDVARKHEASYTSTAW